MKNHQKKSTSYIYLGIKNIWEILAFCFDVKSLLAESRQSIFLFLIGVLVGYICVIAFHHILKAKNNNKNSQASLDTETIGV